MARGIVVTSLVDAVVDDLRTLVVTGDARAGHPPDRAGRRHAVRRGPGQRARRDRAPDGREGPRPEQPQDGPRGRAGSRRRARHLPDPHLPGVRGAAPARRRTPRPASRHARPTPRSPRSGRSGSYAVVEPDMRFHTSLIDALGSTRTSAMYHSLAFEVKLCMAQLQGRQRLSPEIIVAEHARLLELIEAGRRRRRGAHARRAPGPRPRAARGLARRRGGARRRSSARRRCPRSVGAPS